MPGNDFEKNVQQNMNELKLHPSAEVWERVKVRIQGKKRRRLIIFWLIIPALLLGGGVSVFVLTKERDGKLTVNKEKENPFPENTKNNAKGTEPITGSDSKTDLTTSEPEENRIQQADKKDRNERTVALTKTMSNKEKVITSIKDQIISQKNVIVKTNKDNISEDKNDMSLIKAGVDRNDNTSGNLSSDIKRDSVTAFQTDLKKTDSLKHADKSETEQPVVAIAEKAMHDKKKKDPAGIAKKTKWGFAVQAGRSYTPDKRDLFNFQPVNYYASPQSSQGSYNTSVLRPAFSFGMNLFARQRLTDRLDLNVGFGYSYMSSRLNIGNRVDSSGILSGNIVFNNFYRAAGNSNYTNHYHFADISVSVAWQIVKRKKIQINWENGFNVSRLIASDALHYSSALPGFYKDFARFTKNHFSISTGLSIPVINKEKIRIEINPFASYSLTPVLRNSSDSLNTHFTNYGIRLNFLLQGKKQMQR